MKLSLITVCYNIKSKIEKTCKSITSQLYQDFEWIVVDGGSTDGTLEVLKEYSSRINILISEKDNGIYHAMNKGIAKASGTYLNFMNGGDEFHLQDALKNVINELDGTAEIVYTNFKFVNFHYIGDELIKKFPRNLTPEFFLDDCLGHQASFIKKAAFVKYGKYNEKNKIVSDWEKWIEFFFYGCSFKYVDVITSIQYYDGISANKLPEIEKKHKIERDAVIEKYYNNKHHVEKYSIFGFSFLEKISTSTEKDYLLFSCLNILKIQYLNSGMKMKIYLFKFLPIFKKTMKVL